MNLIETNGYLTWLSQADARIQVTDPNVQIWQDALANASTAEVRAATLEFTRTNDGVMVSPSAIRRMSFAVRERAIAAGRALTSMPMPRTNALSWREKNPAEWDRLFEAGRVSWCQEHGVTP